MAVQETDISGCKRKTNSTALTQPSTGELIYKYYYLLCHYTALLAAGLLYAIQTVLQVADMKIEYSRNKNIISLSAILRIFAYAISCKGLYRGDDP